MGQHPSQYNPCMVYLSASTQPAGLWGSEYHISNAPWHHPLQWKEGRILSLFFLDFGCLHGPEIFFGGGMQKTLVFLIPLQSWNTPRSHWVIRLFVAHYYDTLLWRTACCTGPFNQTNWWSVAYHHPSWPTTVFQERKKTLQLFLERERSDLSVTESSMCVTIMAFPCVTLMSFNTSSQPGKL